MKTSRLHIASFAAICALAGAPVLWDRVTETYFRNGGKYLLAGGGAERPIESPFLMIVR